MHREENIQTKEATTAMSKRRTETGSAENQGEVSEREKVNNMKYSILFSSIYVMSGAFIYESVAQHFLNEQLPQI